MIDVDIFSDSIILRMKLRMGENVAKTDICCASYPINHPLFTALVSLHYYPFYHTTNLQKSISVQYPNIY
jgi:hypothetical protein